MGCQQCGYRIGVVLVNVVRFAFAIKSTREFFDQRIADKVHWLQSKATCMKDAARDGGKEVLAEIDVDENRLAFPQRAMGFARGYHSNDISAHFPPI